MAARAVGRPVEVQAYADRIVIRQDGRIVAEHQRSFDRGQTIYDPWHYVPVLARKPGALRNGAPFKDWVLPAARWIGSAAGSPAPMTAIDRWSKLLEPIGRQSNIELPYGLRRMGTPRPLGRNVLRHEAALIRRAI